MTSKDPLLAAYEDDSISNIQIADSFNMPYDTVQRARARYRRKAGLPPLRKGRKGTSYEGVDVGQLVKDFGNEALTINDIAVKHNLSWDQVQRARQKWDRDGEMPFGLSTKDQRTVAEVLEDVHETSMPQTVGGMSIGQLKKMNQLQRKMVIDSLSPEVRMKLAHLAGYGLAKALKDVALYNLIQIELTGDK